jgi:post-segregation antitoxin (ccd killing protein)
MKKIIFLIMLIGFCNICFADVVVIYNNSDQTILTISNKDDTVIPQGYTKAVLKGNVSDYGFTDNPTNYKYIGGKFILNLDKINSDYQTQQAAQVSVQDEQVIQAKIRKIAIDALTTDGVQLQSPANAQAQASMKAQTAQPVKAQ